MCVHHVSPTEPHLLLYAHRTTAAHCVGDTPGINYSVVSLTPVSQASHIPSWVVHTPVLPSSIPRAHAKSRKTTADLRDCMSVSASVAGSAPPPVLTEWVWDSSKSRRWNQDRQRESGTVAIYTDATHNIQANLYAYVYTSNCTLCVSDECRLTALSDQLSQLATPTPPTTHNRPYRDRDREAVCMLINIIYNYTYTYLY